LFICTSDITSGITGDIAGNIVMAERGGVWLVRRLLFFRMAGRRMGGEGRRGGLICIRKPVTGVPFVD
jgi:hypothetical protein